MIPFLYNTAQAFFKTYGQEVSRFAFVFPNRRAGLFFQRYLSVIAKQPLFSPEILTISDLFTRLSPYRTADRIEMLFTLYDIYKQVNPQAETFDEFVFWGEMLLNDFDDVDKYLVDAQQLFRNISDLKEIDAGFDYLTEEQVKAIRRFWVNFLPVGESSQKQDFQAMWQVLFRLYSELRQKLSDRNLAYEGMIFRDVAERARAKEEMVLPFSKVVFVGLNAHSRSEEELLKHLQRIGIADFYWDYSSSLVKDANNKASFFISKNKQFESKLQLSPEQLPLELPIVEAIGIPSAVGQAKYVNTILNALMAEGELRADQDVLNTAIILPDENLLLPTLYSIPPEIKKINVTMGYNLHHSSVAGLMEHIFSLQQNVRFSNGKQGFYYKHVLQILNHQHLSSLLGAKAAELRLEIVQHNKVIVTTDELKGNPLLEHIFTPVEDWQQIPKYLKEILMQINQSIVRRRKETSDESDTSAIEMESEFVIEYYKTINKMDEAIKKAPSISMSVNTYFLLLKKLIIGISVPFSGEPLSGLQVMGVLETRALDFENLIILSMNEGTFPLKKAANSFIPYNLRHGFGLPTYEHQDSIYTYHFYRMINRAKRIFLLYDTRTEGLQTGEVSRYFYQIKHLYSSMFDVRECMAVYEVSTNTSLSIAMQKNQQTETKLNDFLSGGERSLSASAINMYLDCPLQFYFSVIEGLNQDDDIAETVEASTFGSIFHSVMEWLYEPFKGKLVTADLLHKIEKNDKLITETIERSFAKNYFKTSDIRHLTGQNYLTGEVLRKYVKQVLATDARLTPFVYIESEKRIKTDYVLPSGKIVSLKGFIDRVDEVNGHIRIIDYKTGKGILRFTDVEQLFDKDVKDRPKAVMQVFMYAYLYLNEYPGKIIEPGIYYLRNLFDDKFDADVLHKPSRTDSVRITDFSEYNDGFRAGFDACLEEIFDPGVPFIQTKTGKACEWCEFTNICKK
ncbi:MAG: PD-(D/E)XK nuclease family protein [Dysgonomonas sp.]